MDILHNFLQEQGDNSEFSKTIINYERSMSMHEDLKLFSWIWNTAQEIYESP